MARLLSENKWVSSAGLFITAAVTLLLLFMGIDNAWNVVTYTPIAHVEPENTRQD